MYYAKKNGGANYYFYSNEMDKDFKQKIEIETSLRKGIIKNEFINYYQPIISLTEKKIVKVEALVRWNNPLHGMIQPDNFIPLSEKMGVIHQIGEEVLKKAGADAKIWEAKGYAAFSISVNLSPVQLHHENFVPSLLNILKEIDLNPKRLNLEITETAIIHDLKNTIAVLKEIHKHGINLHIDDFGTGNTSIAYLSQFPVNVLKIDQSFIRELPHNKNKRIITHALIKLAHNLNLKVIAEGVENIDQLKYLMSVGCDYAQGFYFSKPLPADEIPAKLSEDLLKIFPDIVFTI